jgi:hypothetical protein
MGERLNSPILLWDYPWNRFQDDAIRVTEVFQESTVILVARGHPLADRDEVKMEDLRKESWIVRAEAHPVVDVLQRSAYDAGFEHTIAFLANDYQEAQAMVSVGMGVAMVPKAAVALQHPDVRVLSLGTAAPMRRVLLANARTRSTLRQRSPSTPLSWKSPANMSGTTSRAKCGCRQLRLILQNQPGPMSGWKAAGNVSPNLRSHGGSVVSVTLLCKDIEGRRCDVLQVP